MSIFPMIQPEATELEEELELYKEVKWDYDKNIPVFSNGSPVVVTGKEAVLVWARKALQTQRYRYDIYSWDYGSETESLIGQPFDVKLKESEAARYIKECLLVNPYITDIQNISVVIEGEELNIECTIETVYGEVNLNV